MALNTNKWDDNLSPLEAEKKLHSSLRKSGKISKAQELAFNSLSRISNITGNVLGVADVRLVAKGHQHGALLNVAKKSKSQNAGFGINIADQVGDQAVIAGVNRANKVTGNQEKSIGIQKANEVGGEQKTVSSSEIVETTMRRAEETTEQAIKNGSKIAKITKRVLNTGRKVNKGMQNLDEKLKKIKQDIKTQ